MANGKWKVSVWHNSGAGIVVPADIKIGTTTYHVNVSNDKSVFLSNVETALGSRPSGWDFITSNTAMPVTGLTSSVGGTLYSGSAQRRCEAVPWYEKDDTYEWKKTSDYGNNYNLDIDLIYGRFPDMTKLSFEGSDTVRAVYGTAYAQDWQNYIITAYTSVKINYYEVHCQRFLTVSDDGNERIYFLCKSGSELLKCTIKIYSEDYTDITGKFTKYKFYHVYGNSSYYCHLYLENDGENLPNGNYRVVTELFDDNPEFFKNPEFPKNEGLSIYAVPLVERTYGSNGQNYFGVGNENNSFVVLVGNDKNKDIEYNISVENSESSYRKFYIKSTQINIGDGRAVFVVEKRGYEDGGSYTTRVSYGTFSVTGGKNDTAVEFVVSGRPGDQHDYYIRSFENGKYSSVQYCSYTGGTYSIDLYGAADGACMIANNKTYSYTNNTNYASEEPNDIREFNMVSNFAHYDAIEKGLVTESYDGDEMIRNMSFDTEWKISKMNYTITENTMGRVRFGAVRLESESNIDGHNTYYDSCEHVRFVLQESQTVKLVFDNTSYVFTSAKLSVIGTVDLSQSGKVYEFERTASYNGAPVTIAFLDNSASSKITVTISNGETVQQKTTTNGMMFFSVVPSNTNGTNKETFYVRVL